MGDFKSNVTRLVNISKVVHQPGEHCCIAVTYESEKIRRENLGPRLLKVCFCNFDYCFQKQKWKLQRNLLLILQIEDDSKNTQHGLLYVCISTLIVVINLFCFNNCGLFCLCYITKHLITAPSGNICFLSFKSRCFPQLRLGKDRDSRETKRMFPS